MSHSFHEKYLVLCRFATTADEHQVCVSTEAAEIIRISWSIVDTSNLEVRKSQSVLVRPIHTPVTELCTGMTGLTWADVEGAQSLGEGLKEFEASLQQEIFSNSTTHAIVVYDFQDFRLQLARESRQKTIDLPEFLRYPRIYDIREEFAKWQQSHPQAHAYGPPSLPNTCAALAVEPPLYYTEPSLGVRATVSEKQENIDHCEIYLKLLKSLLTSSSPADSVLTTAQDFGLDYRAFVKQVSKVLHLSGLSLDTTQSELESWFTQHGGRPLAFWTLRTPDPQKPTGTGFAVFPSHEEALNSLELNGRTLAERTILISPSSPRIMDRAAGILTPFPPSKNRPRPGDWTCPSCGFSNFQRRTACFRCSYPAGNAIDPYYPMHPSMSNMSIYQSAPTGHNGSMRPMGGSTIGGGGHVPFRAGDWSCSTCAYHNFARNSVCLKCSMPRTQQPESAGMNSYNDYGVMNTGPPGGGGAAGGNGSYYNMAGITDDMSRHRL